MAKRDIPNTNEIQMYMHCAHCLAEKPADKSPQEWSQTEVGWTTESLSVSRAVRELMKQTLVKPARGGEPGAVEHVNAAWPQAERKGLQ
jgi:hypothetical protein